MRKYVKPDTIKTIIINTYVLLSIKFENIKNTRSVIRKVTRYLKITLRHLNPAISVAVSVLLTFIKK